MDHEPVDLYCDGVQVNTSAFDCLINLTKRPSSLMPNDPPIRVACIRMSLEHAKILAILLKKGLMHHEEAQESPIVIHPQVYQQLGISPAEDW
jgi:hypothetical protein